ncbi:hypothetical protein DUNSADRAFT_1958 [Dunaliella salina]|uniref:peptidylprolyl isomerase n=1 Tax=Dunaliella salina TaxID=3046 RepID=A0ABQ7GWF3_DUNSA|nr:hypothetical protein DUNSADRAFT_1958 [Dunaliella salina]|eukprot:KAF5838942.1 hypothetical protein DUNSADRAFT_1958 [Dunaliella salina]
MMINCAPRSTAVVTRHGLHTCAPSVVVSRKKVWKVQAAPKPDVIVEENVQFACTGRRSMVCSIASVAAALPCVQPLAAQAIDIANDKYDSLPSGLKILDVKIGNGAFPEPGDVVVVHWAGYTKGYQGKRIDNTSVRDEPYTFTLGKHEAIPAFEQAVSTMRPGGIRRVEIPGEIPELSYPRDRSQRFTNELKPSSEGKIYKYRYGPQPSELGGQRSLDFVLDNPTLYDLNRTLLMDIKLLRVRKQS